MNGQDQARAAQFRCPVCNAESGAKCAPVRGARIEGAHKGRFQIWYRTRGEGA